MNGYKFYLLLREIHCFSSTIDPSTEQEPDVIIENKILKSTKRKNGSAKFAKTRAFEGSFEAFPGPEILKISPNYTANTV